VCQWIFFAAANIWQGYKQERGYLMQFARLANSLLKDEESAQDNHVLACNFVKYSPISIFVTHRLSNKLFLIWLLTSAQHLKCAATLPCNLSLRACFAYIKVSQGSVATCARCGGIFKIHLTANLPRNLPVNFFKSVTIWQNYGHESASRFFGPPCIPFEAQHPHSCTNWGEFGVEESTFASTDRFPRRPVIMTLLSDLEISIRRTDIVASITLNQL